jgi:NAD(P)-dependent dehydrogenase (short-subunit alcohol dehydrogenase family)
VILVTGASTGIGRATAKLLASKGYQVYGAVRSPERVEPLPGVELVRVDVRDDASVAAGVDVVLRKAGRIDVLLNNAGYNLVGAVEETSIEQAQALFDTNVFGVLRMIRAVLPSMRRERSGLIINVSSVLGFLPAPFMGLYASSKHAIEGLSESLDHEVRGLGIRVTLVEPSFTNVPPIRSRLIRSSQAELRRHSQASSRWLRLRTVSRKRSSGRSRAISNCDTRPGPRQDC